MGKDFSVQVEFQSKAPHTTSWIEVSCHVEMEPDQLLSDLARVGWEEDGMKGAPPTMDGRTQIHLVRSGTGLFGEWTPPERREAMSDAMAVLRIHRIKPTTRKLTLQDLL